MRSHNCAGWSLSRGLCAGQQLRLKGKHTIDHQPTCCACPRVVQSQLTGTRTVQVQLFATGNAAYLLPKDHATFMCDLFLINLRRFADRADTFAMPSSSAFCSPAPSYSQTPCLDHTKFIWPTGDQDSLARNEMFLRAQLMASRSLAGNCICGGGSLIHCP